jgi:hypothetical protein
MRRTSGVTAVTALDVRGRAGVSIVIAAVRLHDAAHRPIT